MTVEPERVVHHYLVTIPADSREQATELMRHLMKGRFDLAWSNIDVREIDRLRRVVDRYGKHDDDCAYEVAYRDGRDLNSVECDCGFDTAAHAAAGHTAWPEEMT